jgi:hypothetical protein
MIRMKPNRKKNIPALLFSLHRKYDYLYTLNS